MQQKGKGIRLRLDLDNTVMNPVVVKKKEEYGDVVSQRDVQIEESHKRFALRVVPESLCRLKKNRDIAARFYFSEQNEQYFEGTACKINYFL